MIFPDEFEIFDRKFIYDGIFYWNGSFDEYNIKVRFCLLDKDTVYEDSDIEDTILVHCDVYLHNDLVSIGVANDFYFAAIDAELHHKLKSLSLLQKELNSIKSSVFNS